MQLTYCTLWRVCGLTLDRTKERTNMADDDFDYGEDSLEVDSVNGDSGLAALSALVTRANQVDIEVARAEDQLKKLKEDQLDLKQRRIPDLMDELDMASFTTKSGLKVGVTKKVRAKITDATRGPAIEWFIRMNFERMVKNEFKLALDKGNEVKPVDDDGKEGESQVDLLIKSLDKLKLPYTNKKNVHPSSLAAFVKQRDAAGEEVPDDLFNVFRFSEAKIG